MTAWLCCWECNQIASEAWFFCPFCGTQLWENREAVRCMNCGNTLSEDWEICSNCGVELWGPATEDTSEE